MHFCYTESARYIDILICFIGKIIASIFCCALVYISRNCARSSAG